MFLIQVEFEHIINSNYTQKEKESSLYGKRQNQKDGNLLQKYVGFFLKLTTIFNAFDMLYASTSSAREEILNCSAYPDL